MLSQDFQEFDALFLKAAEGLNALSESEIERLSQLTKQIAPEDEKAARLLRHWLSDGAKLEDLIILHSHLMYRNISPLIGQPGPWEDFKIQIGDQAPRAKQRPNSLILIAENIRSAHNIGSLFRLADCAGVKQLILTGYTCTPSNSTDITKTAMGCEQTVPWLWLPDSRLAIERLQKEGILCFGLETITGSTDLTKERPAAAADRAIAMLLGNEHWGIAPTTLGILDGFMSIPTFGCKNSLNVVQAASIATYLLTPAIFNR